ncbi:ANR family transcriptional regulator [Actinobacillus pleuropneumoniae]|uniref:ANR family transcriptional regulator n=1 Tax=Actinobacillus pleuropneumoniae TaxID=715 RepID=UPI00201FB4D9|nr:ANR family transcriptional regulator [Actinobacillus pleuropneumoniae]MCL7726133.1 ANR family transcriptional regulator [Actinobacillus pleuropneumoniae]MCL7737361.1 ANR family transcriptional regulator [Actinobacillus pleuropneumoniae]
MSTQKFDRYKHYSEQAAKLEAEGNYGEASFKWQVANLSAKGKNVQWTEQRKAFCERMQDKPF